MTVKGFWVYTHTTPDGFVYVGRSGEDRTNYRWQASHYNHTSLEKHIEKWGWQNITHEIMQDGLTEEESFELEREYINMYSEYGILINVRRSGIPTSKTREISRKYYQKNKKEISAKAKAKRAAKRTAKVSPKLTTPATNQNTQPSDYQWGDPLF